ncbi:hypothetical protein BOTBODRAFT_310989 [Botryobasidium botryosum FD-172 SS1]|uniref:Anti-proliferative protein domain-containing protein n=1 Tax=Botryobasidium botryosum (strain FD-172 SS1) TaxID=930990 RepID=A0A067MXR1_BOTB1|nr:hypothetical protein BOTBODRAFT_310989 [Botryobasidium botryosum FD-172 SS1]
MDASLHAAISATLSYLVNPLVPHYPAHSVDALHLALMSSLYVHLHHSWDNACPTRGSLERVLLLTPRDLPPAPLQGPSRRAGIRWFDWILLLSKGEDVEICIDPGCVKVRQGASKAEKIVWEDESAIHTEGVGKRMPWDVRSPVLQKDEKTPRPDWCSSFPSNPSVVGALSRATSEVSRSPLSELLEIDDDFDFDKDFVPFCPRPTSVVSNTLHARTASESTSSSLYSDLSEGLSALSLVSSRTSASSVLASPCMTPATSENGDDLSELDIELLDAEEAEVYYIDSSRKTAVEYECGKVGVLGGAVMLGVPRADVIKNFKIQK